ncbi:DUF881 domain-containing protein [Schaalia suimastitidis]|uniref:DUF881 domain-containing protein n=1 Tax=Schaalia suimastitidis TaxID=121163 RepID=UPI00040B5E08|nr:DUF881 domain-containing protein [Schaalia suimastitidis]
MNEKTSDMQAQVPEAPSWRKLRDAILATPRALHVLLLVICFSLGVALVTQVKAQRLDPLETLDQEDLVVLLNELDAREQVLRQERNDLQGQLTALQNAASEQEAAAEAARAATEVAQILSGAVPVHGEGVLLIATDPTRSLTATQFVMTLGELRNAGAEAIELNGLRVTMRSSFVSNDSGIYLDGTLISSPYRWNIIGPAQTIATALEIQAGSAAQMRAKNATVDVIIKDDIHITSVAPEFQHQWATIE